MNPSFFMSNIYGHNAKSIRPSNKVDDNEVREIVQDVIYNTNNFNDNKTTFYHPPVSSESHDAAKHNTSNTKQKVRISEDLYLAIRQIVKDELKEFKKSLKQKDYTNEFISINKNFKMLEKEISKLKEY